MRIETRRPRAQVSGLSDEAAIQSSAEHDAPTEISGPLMAVSSPASELMWTPDPGNPEADESAGPRRGISTRAATIISAGVVLVVVGALAVRGKKGTTPPAPLPVAATTPSAAAPSPAAPVTVPRLPGDSTAVGLGQAAKGAGRGKPLREVTVDAVALLQLTLARQRAAVGDTVHANLNALDDAGQAVTTPQIILTVLARKKK